LEEASCVGTTLTGIVINILIYVDDIVYGEHYLQHWKENNNPQVFML
jgi:hypothetical protein